MSAWFRCTTRFGISAGSGEEHQGSRADLHGAEDEVAPLAEVNTLIEHLRAAKVDWQLDSGSRHGFTTPQNASEERADREYKAAMARFFREVFGQEVAQK